MIEIPRSQDVTLYIHIIMEDTDLFDDSEDEDVLLPNDDSATLGPPQEGEAQAGGSSEEDF